ncbi:hypothetical protein OHV90_18795, partial [Acinetobacter baumannii]|nr:hypothetical protein [Acinetobacter baumannii]
MAQLAPMMQLRPRFEDKCGHPLAGGNVFAFEAGTSNPKATYADAEGTIPNTHPIKLDYRGEADIFLLSGRYRFVVYSCTGVKIYDVDDVGEWLGPNNALAITHLDTLEALEGVTNVWDGRTIYVKDIGMFEYDALRSDWIALDKDIVTTVESIADLTGLEKWDGRAIYVKSVSPLPPYSGGGTFVFSTQTDKVADGYLVVNDIGGKWLKQSIDITVDDFGGVGDNTKDNSDAFNAYASSPHVGMEIRLGKKGRYRVAKQVDLKGKNLVGSGMGKPEEQYYNLSSIDVDGSSPDLLGKTAFINGGYNIR